MAPGANEDTIPQADTLLDRALDHMAAGDPTAAIPHLRQALRLDPTHTSAAHALLRALEDAGRLDQALTLCRTLIAADPEDPLLHTRLSILLQRHGDIPGAEAASARARILDWKRQLRTPSEPETLSDSDPNRNPTR